MTGTVAGISESRRIALERIAARVMNAAPIERPVIPASAAPPKNSRARGVGKSAVPKENRTLSGIGTADEPQLRPVIKLVGGELPRIVDEAEAALIASKPDLYRYGG